MEIRNWLNQQLVFPADMDGSTSDMYQRDYDYNNFPPIVLYGLQYQSVSGNTVAFSPGAARCKDITVANYPFLPVPTYGTGYPGIIEIPAASNSVTLNTSMTPSYIVATYTISPTTSGQILYTVTGHLSQVSSVNTTNDVVLAVATYSMGAWTIDQTPLTHRSNDAFGQSAIQYDLTNDKVLINNPVGKSGTTITAKLDFVASQDLTFQGNLFDGLGYKLNVSKIDIPTTGSAINALNSSHTMVRFTGSTATTVNGIVAGIEAQEMTIYNQSSANITFTNSSGSASTGNQILTATAGSIVLAAGYCLSFIYDNTAGFWIPSLFTY